MSDRDEEKVFIGYGGPRDLMILEKILGLYFLCVCVSDTLLPA